MVVWPFTPTANITLFAKWNATPTEEDPIPEDKNRVYIVSTLDNTVRETIDIPDNTALSEADIITDFANDAYAVERGEAFVGYSYSSYSYWPVDFTQVLTENKHIFAWYTWIWEGDVLDTTTATLTLDLDGGEIVGGTTKQLLKAVRYDTRILPVPTKDNYTFVGWANGWDEDWFYTTQIDLSSGDSTLKALWSNDANVVAIYEAAVATQESYTNISVVRDMGPMVESGIYNVPTHSYPTTQKMESIEENTVMRSSAYDGTYTYEYDPMSEKLNKYGKFMRDILYSSIDFTGVALDIYRNITNAGEITKTGNVYLVGEFELTIIDGKITLSEDNMMNETYTFGYNGDVAITPYMANYVMAYYVNVNLNGGTITDGDGSGYVSTGTSFALPTVSYYFHTFDGWYYDAAFTRAVSGDSFTVSGDTNVYAKWTAFAGDTGAFYTMDDDLPHNGDFIKRDYESMGFKDTYLSTTGEYHALVVPIEFNDSEFMTSGRTAPGYEAWGYNTFGTGNDLANINLAFNGTHASTGYESVASYYYKSSYGKLDLTFDIVDPVKVNLSAEELNAASGANSTTQEQTAIRAALDILDATVDFTNYDYDNDGFIDGITFIPSYGVGSMGNAFTRAHTADFYGPSSSINARDGKKLYGYMWASWANMLERITGFDDAMLEGTNYGLLDLGEGNFASRQMSWLNTTAFIHEFGHMLGLADYYDGDGGPYEPLGGMDMMGKGMMGDQNPWSKMMLGWIEPTIITYAEGGEDVRLRSFEETGDALLVPYGEGFSGTLFDEYLMICYRTGTGLNAQMKHPTFAPLDILTGEIIAGIVIYHVYAKQNTNYGTTAGIWYGFEVQNGDDNGNNKHLVDIIQADGDYYDPDNAEYVCDDAGFVYDDWKWQPSNMLTTAGQTLDMSTLYRKWFSNDADICLTLELETLDATKAELHATYLPFTPAA